MEENVFSAVHSLRVGREDDVLEVGMPEGYFKLCESD